MENDLPNPVFWRSKMVNYATKNIKILLEIVYKKFNIQFKKIH